MITTCFKTNIRTYFSNFFQKQWWKLKTSLISETNVHVYALNVSLWWHYLQSRWTISTQYFTKMVIVMTVEQCVCKHTGYNWLITRQRVIGYSWFCLTFQLYSFMEHMFLNTYKHVVFTTAVKTNQVHWNDLSNYLTV